MRQLVQTQVNQMDLRKLSSCYADLGRSVAQTFAYDGSIRLTKIAIGIIGSIGSKQISH